MIAQTNPDVIIVTGRDDTHVTYILKALQHDLDVLSEKPMATTGADCRRIMEPAISNGGIGSGHIREDYRFTKARITSIWSIGGRDSSR